MAVIFSNRTGGILARVADDYSNRGAPALQDRFGDAQTRIQKVQVQGAEQPPPYACMKVQASYISPENQVITLVTKPDGTGGPFLFNGPRAIEGGTGGGRTGLVEGIAAIGQPPAQAGELWGPVDSWELVRDGTPAIQVLGQDLASRRILGLTSITGANGSGTTAIVKGPEGGIEGRVGNAIPFGVCTLMTIDAYDEINQTGNRVSVYNWTTQLIWSKGERLGVAALGNDGLWIAVSGDCHDDATDDGTVLPDDDTNPI
jgi:hypothetical protein